MKKAISHSSISSFRRGEEQGGTSLGASSPILNWFAAYYKPGKVSTGFEVWITKSDFNENHSRYKAELSLMIRQNLMSVA